MLGRGLVALPALRDFDVMAVIKAEKLERLEAWIHVRQCRADRFLTLALDAITPLTSQA
jgi:hypothetical protein